MGGFSHLFRVRHIIIIIIIIGHGAHGLNLNMAATHITTTNNNKRPLTPKSMPPAGYEHANSKSRPPTTNARSNGKLENKTKHTW